MSVAESRVLPLPFTDEEQMIRGCRRTIRRIVGRWTRRDRRLDFDDLYQVACVAFVRAFRSYDPLKINPQTGYRYSFVAYAGKSAFFLIKEHVRNHFKGGFSRFPEALDPFRDAPRMTGLTRDFRVSEHAGSEVAERDDSYLVSALAVEDESRDLEGVWRVAEQVLDHREYWVLWSVYAQGRTDAQVARWLGVSRVRVGQIHKAALEKLRPRLQEFVP